MYCNKNSWSLPVWQTLTTVLYIINIYSQKHNFHRYPSKRPVVPLINIKIISKGMIIIIYVNFFGINTFWCMRPYFLSVLYFRHTLSMHGLGLGGWWPPPESRNIWRVSSVRDQKQRVSGVGLLFAPSSGFTFNAFKLSTYQQYGEKRGGGDEWMRGTVNEGCTVHFF